MCVLSAPGKEAAVLPWEVRHKVAVGIARALEYLHKGCTKPVVHRDVKTSNILLTANFESQVSFPLPSSFLRLLDFFITEPSACHSH